MLDDSDDGTVAVGNRDQGAIDWIAGASCVESSPPTSRNVSAPRMDNLRRRITEDQSDLVGQIDAGLGRTQARRSQRSDGVDVRLRRRIDSDQTSNRATAP